MRAHPAQSIRARVRAKLRSRRGESITEVLAATVVGGLAILMLAMAIATASKMVMASNDAMDDYYDNGNVIAESAGDALSGTVTLQSDGKGVALVRDSALDVVYYESEQTGSVPIVSFEAAGEGGTA